MRVSPATWLVMVQPWQEVGEPLARAVMSMGDFEPGQEIISIGGGEGRFAIWVAERQHAQVEAVDPDPAAVARGEAAARRLSLARRPRIQLGSPTDLPHESGVFDGAIVDFLTLGPVPVPSVLGEAARVLKPYGVLVALAPVWHEPPAPEVRKELATRLGITAHLAVQWKQWLRAAGLVEIVIRDYPGAAWAIDSRVSAMIRGRRVAGWQGVRAALSPAARMFWREIARRRLGLTLLRGVRWPEQPAAS